LNVRKENLKNSFDYAEISYTREQTKQWSVGKRESSLNLLLSGFIITMNLHLCYLEGLMRPASFSKLTLV